MLSKVYKYLAAIAAGALAVIGIFLSGRKAGKDAVNLDNERYQKESLEKAYKAKSEANEKGEEVKKDAIEKANDNDFSGFNNKL